MIIDATVETMEIHGFLSFSELHRSLTDTRRLVKYSMVVGASACRVVRVRTRFNKSERAAIYFREREVTS